MASLLQNFPLWHHAAADSLTSFGSRSNRSKGSFMKKSLGSISLDNARDSFLMKSIAVAAENGSRSISAATVARALYPERRTSFPAAAAQGAYSIRAGFGGGLA
jgi:hypothetical protein